MLFGLLILDTFIILFAWVISCFFSLDPKPLIEYLNNSIFIIPVLLFIKIFMFYRMGLYKAILRYASFHFARTIVKVITLSSFFSYIIINFMPNNLPDKWPFGLLIMDWLLTLALVGFSRFIPRYYSENFNKQENSSKKIKVLLYGAGDVGDILARSLLEQVTDYKAVGFIDDDPKKKGKKLHNLPIFGNRVHLNAIIKEHQINEIIICMKTRAEWLRGLIKECRQYQVFVRLAPKITDMKNHDFHLKNIAISDLLKRDPQDLDENQIKRFLTDKKILITGAAGSIGSELVRQAIQFNPKKICLLDNNEFGLYKIEEELKKNDFNQSRCKFILENLCCEEQINCIVAEEQPDIIFHAAAYKHVPILESSPFSGVINNIQGTLNIAKAADRNSVQKLVLISTDKAVKPTNIMGATKRICELFVQNLNLKSQTEFVAVRFGNVLGSSGSVIPKFLDQIKAGGPITVTHPEVTRYFMLIQEAVQLVMQAASIGHGTEIFILNMGKPVKIKEMAEDLIFLAGKTPYKDIDIQSVGLRPGEKLIEELFISEFEKKTQYENITIGKMTFIEWDRLNQLINQVLFAAQKRNRSALLLNIKEIVTEFNHVDIPQKYILDNVVPIEKSSFSKI